MSQITPHEPDGVLKNAPEPLPFFDILPLARADLQGAFEFLEVTNRARALEFLRAARKTFDQLVEMPSLGVASSYGRDLPMVRQWPVSGFSKYLVFHRIVPQGVEVWRVLHASRDIANLLQSDE